MARITLFAVLLTLFSTRCFGLEHTYLSEPEHSVWVVVDSAPLSCRLDHRVDDYGTFSFQQRAGGELSLQLTTGQAPAQAGKGHLLVTAPPWRHGLGRRDLGEVAVAAGYTPLHLDKAMALQLLAALEDGLQPMLIYDDGVQRVRAGLSPVHFSAALPGFRHCLSGLLPFDFDAVKTSMLTFGFGSARLSETDRARLDQVGRYLLADPSVKKVTVEGHTDSRGYRGYNDILAKQRAEAVRDYLLAKGVAADRLTLHAYGERRPLRSNRSETGRAKNRRVLVTLSR